MEFSIEKIPTYALCYLISDDKSGLTEEEVEIIDKWWSDNNVITVSPISEEEGEYHPYFTHYPAFGLAAEVLDCTVMTL